MTAQLILAGSVVCQFVAAAIALRLVAVTGRRTGWVLIAAAMVLQGCRRAVVFARVAAGDAVAVDVVGEGVGLLVSLLLLVGVAWIAPMLRQMRRTRDALARSEERYRTVADFTCDWEYWADPAGKMIYISPSCQRVTGYPPAAFVDDPALIVRLAHPDDRKAVGEHFRQGAEPQPYCEFDFRIVRRDGEERWIEHRCQPIAAADGRYLGRRGSNRDVTDRVRAQRALRDATHKLLTVREAERRALAQELHDSVGHGLYAMQLSLEGAVGAAADDTETLRAKVTQAVRRCGELMDEVRRLCRGLYPPTLESLGLRAALAGLVGDLRTTGQVELSCPDELAERRFQRDVEVALFRIAQESVNNAVRHSNATRIVVELSADDDLLRLAVEDNGAGFDPAAVAGKGLGLNSMQERAVAIGGELAIDSTSGRTRLVATVPIAPRAA